MPKRSLWRYGSAFCTKHRPRWLRWNRKQAAQILNIDYKALLYQMKKLSIEN
jgi:hypothetical protein